MFEKTISVIVPCYNQGEYLTEAIGSVLSQTYLNWECIIVNDGSTDNTEDVALELVRKDARIIYYKKVNGGLASARNFGVEKSSGEYILPLDADDKISSTYIEKALQVFAERDVKVVHCETACFGAKEGKFVLHAFSRSELARMNMIICSAIYRKKDFLAAGGYNENMKFGWEDWDFWISMLKNEGKVFKIPAPLFYYRIKEKEKSMMGSLNERRQQRMYMQIYLNHPDFFDQYYTEPIQLFHQYRDLKNRYNFLTGLIKFKRSSYIDLLKRIPLIYNTFFKEYDERVLKDNQDI